MIVEMKKAYILAQSKNAARVLNELREAGIVHVENIEERECEDVAELERQSREMDRLLDFVRGHHIKGQEQADLEDWNTKAGELFDQIKEALSISEEVLHLDAQIEQWSDWGNFDPVDIEELAKHNVTIKLYRIPLSELNNIADEYSVNVIQDDGRTACCVVVARQEIDLDFDEVLLPVRSLAQMKEQKQKLQTKYDELQKELAMSGRYADAFTAAKKEIEQALEFAQVKAGLSDQENLMYLKGYFPVEFKEDILAKAQHYCWGIIIEDITEEDTPPTLLSNPKWVELIKPVFDVVEIVPGYREFDVSPVFLIFFVLFFAVLIGDAAYGMLFALFTFIVQQRIGHKCKNQAPFVLMYVLTFFTVVWGILTGTFFGQQWLPSWVEAQVPWLNDFSNMQYLCFVIALVHLTIARVWVMVARFPSITWFSSLGWLLITWGMFFVANMFVLGKPLPGYALWLFYAGIPLAFFFMVPPRKLLKVAGQEAVPFLLNIVNAGTDIVSYIRLFAVGLATVAVADATNTMASEMPAVFGIIVFVFGHALNMILAMMAILVHAIRLNVLEFSGQLGLEWSGHPYRPFKSILKT